LDNNKIKVRMSELIRPIDEAIMMCDSREEILMLASLMLVRLKDIYDTQIGEEGRKIMFGDFA
jgi:hypothetical protein|tara:strand:+ start:404 stop:592 length:189 start_codon:yes stop_codon:yes gene_type:complete